MITFLVCLAALVAAYFLYGGYLERLVRIDPAAETPCRRLYDGVDYVPCRAGAFFLIQLLNIAGLGPIFGAVLGAAYGPVAFLWITLGGIFMGAMHDFIAGVVSLRHDGASLPETAGIYLGEGSGGRCGSSPRGSWCSSGRSSSRSRPNSSSRGSTCRRSKGSPSGSSRGSSSSCWGSSSSII